MYGVDDDKKTPIGLKPSIGPGYSGFRPVQRLQVASDNGKQRKAVAADSVATGLTRQASAAVDGAMQLGAKENAGVLPPSQGGSVTPLLSPERVKRIQARQAAPLVAGINQSIDQSQRVPNGVQLPGINQSLSPMAQQAPIPEPRGLTPQPATPSTADNYASGLAGAGKVVINTAAYAGNAINDGARNAVGYVSGGNTDQIHQYRHDSAAKVGEGFDQMAQASANLRGDAQQVGRDALGIEKRSTAPVAPVVDSANAGELPAPAAGTASPAAAVQAGPVSDAGPQAQGNGFGSVNFDPNQYGDSSNKIVGKVGANGVPEFSNNAADVAGARGQFQAPTGLSKPGKGSASNIGNGVGSFSVPGQPGDAAKAIATYDRANAIRAETNKIRTADEPRGLHIVKDSSRAPSRADMQNARLEARQAQTADIQARGLQAQTNSDREFARNTANDQLNQQKTAQDIQSGQISLQSAQRIDELRRQMGDVSLPDDQRKAAGEAYRALSTSQDKRYITVKGGEGPDGNERASTLYDSLLQEKVDLGAGADSQASDLAQAQRIVAANPDKRAEVERRFKEKYGTGLEG